MRNRRSVGPHLLGNDSEPWRGTQQVLELFCGCEGVSCWGSLLPLLRIKPLHDRNLHFHSREGDPGVQPWPPLPPDPGVLVPRSLFPKYPRSLGRSTLP